MAALVELYLLVVLGAEAWWVLALHVALAVLSWWMSRDRLRLHTHIVGLMTDNLPLQLGIVDIGELMRFIAAEYPGVVTTVMAANNTQQIKLYIGNDLLGVVNLLGMTATYVLNELFKRHPHMLRQKFNTGPPVLLEYQRIADGRILLSAQTRYPSVH